MVRHILHADVLFKPYHHLHLTGTLCQMNHQTSLLQVRRNDPLEDQKMPTTLQDRARGNEETTVLVHPKLKVTLLLEDQT